MEITKYKILIVEDDRDLACALDECLCAHGFTTHTAHDGEEAINKIREIEPHLVLLDIILPIKSGFEVLKEIKQNKNHKDYPVFILTNLDSEDDRKRALKLGAYDYLVKATYSLNDIYEKIDKFFSEKKQNGNS